MQVRENLSMGVAVGRRAGAGDPDEGGGGADLLADLKLADDF
jgi:hypothetical protein